MTRTDHLLELTIGPVAHGGHCVARHEGRVVFVRHTLPGERVLARLTESAAKATFWRADAVQILDPSPDRVAPPCPLSGPGLCGGCDWQHVTLPAQRELKATVIREQLHRLAGLTAGEDGVPEVVVEAVAGDVDGLGWRTRVRFTIGDDGRAGLRKHRSHDVVPVPRCPISAPGIQTSGIGETHWPGAMRGGSAEVVSPDDDQCLVVAEPAEPRGPAGPRGPAQPAQPGGSAEPGPGEPGGREPSAGSWARTRRRVPADVPAPERRVRVPHLPGATSVAMRDADGGLTRITGRTWVRQQVQIEGRPRDFRVTGTGFWQVHPGAAQTLLDTVLAAADLKPGERVTDLYCGAGLFAAGLAEAVGPDGQVDAVEAEPRAIKDARRALHDLQHLTFHTGDVAELLPSLPPADVVVLDPPRTGAGRDIIAGITAGRPRTIVYVACDPAALARDISFAATHGYALTALRAFDLFPMTHHIECVATLTPTHPSP